MILKTAANYNDEGGYIEAWKNSDGTTEVKLIPKSGGDEGKQGLKSITISPEITTDPTLGSIFPFYWDEERADSDGGMQHNIVLFTDAPLNMGEEYVYTITPTPDWHVSIGETKYESGEPANVTVTADSDGALNQIEYQVANDDLTQGIYGVITLSHHGE